MKKFKIISETMFLVILILIVYSIGLVSGINITDSSENLIKKD